MVMENNIPDQKIIDFIKDFTSERHFAPSIRDFLSIGFQSTSHIRYRLDKLVEDGTLGRDPKVARSIYIKKG
jgi:SOS-response transcriptional repressor LexA